jgi:hypothetical protein
LTYRRSGCRPQMGTRYVVLAAAAVVGVVLALQVLSTFVPAVGDFIGLGPVIIVVLVIVTLVVLAGALRPRR